MTVDSKVEKLIKKNILIFITESVGETVTESLLGNKD